MKRANGEGTVYYNGKSWTAQITTATGRPSKSFTTQRKARAWLTEQRRDMDTGDYVEPSSMTLGVWWDKWVELYRNRRVSKATSDSNMYAKKRLSDSLLKKAICDITAEDIQAEWNRLDDDGLTRRTIELTRTPLNTCMSKAVSLRHIRRNPVPDTILPDDDSKPANPLTDAEESKLLEYCLSAPTIRIHGQANLHDVRRQVYKDALLFLHQTGVRRSECLFMIWSDWTDMSVHVRGTKNESSDRMVPVSPIVYSMLKRRKACSESEYVFATTNGQPLNGRNLLRHLTALNGHKVHDLRHTFCTRAARAGINPKVLQTITGHKKIETLLKFYTHVTDTDRADAIAKIFSGCKAVANFAQNADISTNRKSLETLRPLG